jgi:hypothetical protein
VISEVAGLNRPARFWIAFTRDETVGPARELTNRVSFDWARHYAALTGTVAAPGEIGDMEFFSRAMRSRLDPSLQ